MKRLALRDSATQYSVTRNRYGDLQLVNPRQLDCLFRDISTLRRLPTREEVTIQGIFWFDMGSTVGMGDIVGHGGRLYRIEEVISAKDLLTHDQNRFVKCHVSLYRAIS